ncbi:MAG: ATP-binding cassette domain-containing protein [Candidatus Shapirobacteria bacterium]|jgi:cell division transport system ATP-binding protein
MKIVFDQVDKKFGIVYALKDISFEIDQGEFVFLIGNSGAGKSTLLKLILNQLKPTSGKILLGNIDLSNGNKDDVNNTRRRIGVVFQDYQLISDKTIEENIALILDIVNYPKEKIQSRIDKVIKEVNLGTRRFLFPSQLAGGELQRASLARALAIEPEVILADEPTGNLDPENSWNLVKLLKDINKENNTTIIMTTHNNEIVESMGKRVIKINDGEIVKDYNISKKS